MHDQSIKLRSVTLKATAASAATAVVLIAIKVIYQIEKILVDIFDEFQFLHQPPSRLKAPFPFQLRCETSKVGAGGCPRHRQIEKKIAARVEV